MVSIAHQTPGLLLIRPGSLDATQVLSGAVQVQAVLTQRRSGQGDIAVTADLGSAELAVPALDWWSK